MNKNIIFVVGAAIGGIVLGAITDHMATKDAIENVENTIKEITEKDTALIRDLKLQLEASNLCYNDLDNQLKAMIEENKKYDNEEFKEWMTLKTSFKLEKDAFYKYLQEQRKKEEREKEEAVVKKAIEDKDWDKVYNKTEHWYNHNPVDISRAEVFGKLETDGFITKEQRKEAHDYFKDLWFYVGD